MRKEVLLGFSFSFWVNSEVRIIALSCDYLKLGSSFVDAALTCCWWLVLVLVALKSAPLEELARCGSWDVLF